MARANSTNPSESNKVSKKIWKKVVALFFLLGIILGAWFFWKFSSGPAQGVIVRKEATYDLNNPDLPPAITEFKGEYFSIFFPETYIEKHHEIPNRDGNILEQTFFSQDGGSGRKLAVTIEKRPQNGISELSSYRFRTIHPEEYVKDSLRWNENEIPVFKRNKVVYEMVGYIERYDFVASISVSSAIESPEKLIGDFSDIVKSFRWSTSALSI